jgi:DNA-binding transcriptional MerR regulator/methylmalonyl-CoA mutase cobalamin-binding subunit
LNISAVERDTGLSKDTLRVWERRYGFPQPQRDACGERAYSADDLEKLRVLRRLIDAGHRPGKIIGQSLEALHALEARANPAQGFHPGVGTDELQRCIDFVCAHDTDALRGGLSQAALRLGLDRFVIELAAPLDQLVAQLQSAGRIEFFEACLYAESMQVVLRHAIANIPAGRASPRVLLSSFPKQDNVRGLLMAEALLALDGCRCLSLGVQTPLVDIVKAAAAQDVDIVALSFSAALNPNRVLEGLTELRARLPGRTEIWAGGPCPILLRRPPRAVRVIERLEAIAGEVARWRETRGNDAARAERAERFEGPEASGRRPGGPDQVLPGATNSVSTPV